MDAAQRREVRVELREVERELRSWDPIGVILGPDDPDSPLDEYNSYAPGVLGRLRQGADVDTMAQHLNHTANALMGLNRAIEHDREFARHLLAWWQARDGGYDAV